MTFILASALLLQSSGAVIQGPPNPTPVAAEQGQIIRNDYDPRQLAENRERAESKAEARGKTLFFQKCALCHDPTGRSAVPVAAIGPWLDLALVSARGEAAVRASIQKGSIRMPGFQYQWDQATIDQVIAYLKTVGPGARPKTMPAVIGGDSPTSR